MKIQLSISLPGGLQVARTERIAIRQATQNAMALLIQQGVETECGRIVNEDDEQIGSVECHALYSDAPPFGVTHICQSDLTDPARVAVESPQRGNRGIGF